MTPQDINVLEHLDWWTFHLSDETAATLEIRPVQIRGMEAGRYLFDAPIPIQLEISNKTARKTDVTLDEHYRDGRPHRLWGVKVRVRDAEENMLTQNGLSRPELRDWWTFGYLHSDVDVCTIGVDCHLSDDIDTVTLAPGEKVQRIVNLDWFLLGAPLLHGPLPPGRYSLEVKLNKMTSNSLEILVDAPEKDGSSE
ncbi:MAG: hypothetical protein D3904_18320 [Candidatus Electrothrix sp. EH2]|nr:hypothetical protein [Candidatus Electrothrix sp. EH2]